MAERNDSGLDTVVSGAQAAHMIRGAVKTGKAISGAAKGAAAGGPVGAAIGFALNNRQLVGKILIAAIAFLMIPVVILCMLPSVIFGGVTDSHSAADPDNPILNSDIAIIESANEICDRVNNLLSEALAETLREIDRDFDRSSADEMEIENPYLAQISFDAVRLVSMYCAYKEDDVASISIDDLELLIRRNTRRLFSFSCEEETRTVTTPGASDPSEPTSTEVWRIYTIAYHGDSYFANEVFSLSAEQEQLAADYATNLNLFLQDDRYSTSINASFQKNTAIDISNYMDPYTKNNIDLVQWAISAEQNHWGYVWGTYGCILTSDLYAAKLQQYPVEIGRYADFIIANWLGGRTADCVGLIKGYGWLNPDTLEVGYGTNGMPDIGADSMYYNAYEKGPIDTIPDIPGIAVWHTGHIGIYIGNGEVIEAMGTRYGVVRTQVAGSRWTHWLKIPYITYY